jgi:hypothetical protein
MDEETGMVLLVAFAVIGGFGILEHLFSSPNTEEKPTQNCLRQGEP